MSKTVQGLLVEHCDKAEAEDLPRTQGLVGFLDVYGGYPVISCGDSKFVLAVAWEELRDAAIRAASLSEPYAHSLELECADQVVDAILAKLGFREVEEIRHLAIPEGQMEAVIPVRLDTRTGQGCRYVDFAILKPESARVKQEGE